MAVRHLTGADFDGAVQTAPLAVVDFWAAWCGPCKLVAPMVEAIGEQYGDRVLVAKVDTDQEPELVRRFEIEGIPTLVFLKNGREFDRKVGVQPMDAFTAVLEAQLNGAGAI